jgi:protein-disulfide isomerase
VIKYIDNMSRRSALKFIGATVAFTSAPVGAHSLSADDGSLMRSLALPAQKIITDLSSGFRFGSNQPDIIIAELFDYNCSYCRHAHPALLSCVNDDNNIALDLIHFPILSKDSEQAAAIHLAVFLRDGLVPSLSLHNALISFKGRVNYESARSTCADLNILLPSADEIRLALSDIASRRDKARGLGFRFTPTFAIADKSFIGWPGEQTFKNMIAHSRLCGHVQCG